MKTYKKLQEQYSKNGISLVWMKHRKAYALKIVNAPATAYGAKGCQLTGYYVVYSKELLQDIEDMTKTVFDEYKRIYKDNKEMLKYVS